MRSTPSTLPAARMAAVLDRLEQPCADPDFAGFQKALGIETSVARGPHVIVLHQHSDAEADERIALLERVITGYHLLFAAQGIELAVPRRRLVSAWFADQKDYLAFLRSEDADGVRHDARLLSPDLEGRGRFRRASSDAAANGSGKAGGEDATSCSGTASWSTRPRRGAGSRSSSPTSRRGPSAVPRRRRSSTSGRGKSRARRCSWSWIGGRSTWGRRPTR